MASTKKRARLDSRPDLGLPPELSVMVYSFFDPRIKRDRNAMKEMLKCHEVCFNDNAVLLYLYHKWISTPVKPYPTRDQLRTFLRQGLEVYKTIQIDMDLRETIETIYLRRGNDKILKHAIEMPGMDLDDRTWGHSYHKEFKAALKKRNYFLCQEMLKGPLIHGALKLILDCGYVKLLDAYIRCKMHSSILAEVFTEMAAHKDARHSPIIINRAFAYLRPRAPGDYDGLLADFLSNPDAVTICEVLMDRGAKPNFVYANLCAQENSLHVLQLLDRRVGFPGQKHPSFLYSAGHQPDLCIQAWCIEWKTPFDRQGLDSHVSEYLDLWLRDSFRDRKSRKAFLKHDHSLQMIRYIMKNNKVLVRGINNDFFTRYVDEEIYNYKNHPPSSYWSHVAKHRK